MNKCLTERKITCKICFFLQWCMKTTFDLLSTFILFGRFCCVDLVSPRLCLRSCCPPPPSLHPSPSVSLYPGRLLLPPSPPPSRCVPVSPMKQESLSVFTTKHVTVSQSFYRCVAPSAGTGSKLIVRLPGMEVHGVLLKLASGVGVAVFAAGEEAWEEDLSTLTSGLSSGMLQRPLMCSNSWIWTQNQSKKKLKKTK